MTDEPKAPGRLWRAFDSGLFSLMNQRVALTLLAIAGCEALASPFAGTRWAVYALGTAAVGIGLILSAAGLWLQCLGNSAKLISDAYQKEVLRGGSTPQSPAATLPAGRIN